MEASGSDIPDDIASRLRAFRLRTGKAQDVFALEIEIAYGTYKRLEAGDKPKSESLEKLRKAGLNINWLLSGEGEMLLSDQDQHRPYDLGRAPTVLTAGEPDGNYVAIDKYVNVNGSAGPGAEVHEEAIVKVRVDLRLLRERIGNNFGKIKIASVSGDSMEPTLSHGDQVLVDTSCSRFIDDAIYAIQQDGHLRFKRIQLKLDGSIVVKSDGSLNTETYSADEAQRFFVVGIVIPFKFGRFKI
ncbi:XRE family transcriptional regulator [Sideroxydans lithotrophicus]|uniref:Putative phage repressor n=1 Tax=Sideroxydans lithotrophicus (strain ES-1) TaxID=580332 RepID=D5CU95_SIDLE|nr:XRE family transcriptional regulator [Sideroxydans lithotrophicus]ADE10430.1 putative phage repressor [Sideroxydans lithotrophicus ES-1]